MVSEMSRVIACFASQAKAGSARRLSETATQQQREKARHHQLSGQSYEMIDSNATRLSNTRVRYTENPFDQQMIHVFCLTRAGR